MNLRLPSTPPMLPGAFSPSRARRADSAQIDTLFPLLAPTGAAPNDIGGCRRESLVSEMARVSPISGAHARARLSAAAPQSGGGAFF